MNIEQIGLFLVGWFAVGFLVALALGKFIREANPFDDDKLSHAAGAAGASVKYFRQSKRKANRQRTARTPVARSKNRGAKRAASPLR